MGTLTKTIMAIKGQFNRSDSDIVLGTESETVETVIPPNVAISATYE